MDVRCYIVLFTLTWVQAQPMVDEGVGAEISSSTAEDVTTTSTTVAAVVAGSEAPPLVNCQTARAAAGACVVRHYCDYGSPHIDRTLYAPRGYLKSCKDEEVCCPLESIVQDSDTSSQRPQDGDDGAFEFDDDD